MPKHELKRKLEPVKEVEEWKQKAIGLKLSGMNHTQIAKAVGKSRQSVSALFNVPVIKSQLEQEN
ncbi:helix-turn-helix domain-containing protein [Photobacterium sagamiensis]|uniref:helix-turn-helix domain-containing protein n=1 Tax=Photobacterium sagamiensis TaxID=2910241 RepID=UPI003D136ECF